MCINAMNTNIEVINPLYYEEVLRSKGHTSLCVRCISLMSIMDVPV